MAGLDLVLHHLSPTRASPTPALVGTADPRRPLMTFLGRPRGGGVCFACGRRAAVMASALVLGWPSRGEVTSSSFFFFFFSFGPGDWTEGHFTTELHPSPFYFLF